MARGVDGRETFADDRDRQAFMDALRDLQRDLDFSVLAYCLMGNHFHLAVKVRRIPLSKVLQRLLTRYVSTFNARHARTGHLFQARYKASVCVNPAYLVRLVAYIHENPVRAGMVGSAAEWEWSSCRAFQDDSGEAMRSLREELGHDVRIQINVPEAFTPWPSDSPGPALMRMPLTERTAISRIAESIALQTSITIAELRARRRRDPTVLRAKRALIRSCLREGHSLTDTARWMGCTSAAAHYLAAQPADLIN